MDCKLCEIEEVAPNRAALGYEICLTCGEQEAKKETQRKAGRVAIAYDKGGYQYITEEMDPKDFG